MSCRYTVPQFPHRFDSAQGPAVQPAPGRGESPAVPEADLLVVVPADDDVLPAHHIVAVRAHVDGAAACGSSAAVSAVPVWLGTAGPWQRPGTCRACFLLRETAGHLWLWGSDRAVGVTHLCSSLFLPIRQPPWGIEPLGWARGCHVWLRDLLGTYQPPVHPCLG